MVRLVVMALLLSNYVFGAVVGPQICTSQQDFFCPTVLFTVDSGSGPVDYSNNFLITAITPGQLYNISANFNAGGFPVNFNATTHPDPVIDFGMSFGSQTDPMVFLSITTPYVGDVENFTEFSDNLAAQLVGAGSATGTLLNPSNNNLYMEEFLINGAAVDFENSGANPVFTGGPFPNTGNLTLDLGFNVTGGSIFQVGGSVGLTPEPGTLALMGFGILCVGRRGLAPPPAPIAQTIA